MRGNLSYVYDLYKLATEGNENKYKELLSNERFMSAAGITEQRRELLLGVDMEGSTKKLVQEEVYNKVIEGAEPTKVWRNILPVIKTSAYQVRIPYGESGHYADKVPEGGQLPERNQAYNRVNIDLEKYAEQPNITEEMITMSLFDVVELELRKAGAAIENRLNRECLKEILTDCTSPSQYSPAGTHIAVSDIATGIASIYGQNWVPNNVVLHPTAMGYLLQDSNLVYVAYAGQDSTLKSGKLPMLLGCTPHVCTATDADTSATWGDTTPASNVTGIILDSNAPVAMIAEIAEGIKVTQWKDPLYDLHRIAVKDSFGVDTIHTTAAVQIYHK